MKKVAWIGLIVVLGEPVIACKVTNPLYCDEATPCKDPLRPFCDIRGELAASNGVRNTCVAALEGNELADAGIKDSAMPDDAQLPCSYKIAFVSERTGEAQIHLMDADGNNVHTLTSRPKIKSSPIWSSSGYSIFFLEQTLGKNNALLESEVVKVNIDTEDVQRLVSPGISRHLNLSNSGNKLAFISDEDGDYEVFTMNTDGSGLSQLTQNSFDDDAPFWSPVDSQIVFTHNSGSVPRIYKMNSDGTNQLSLTGDPGPDFQPHWSPDGKTIAFMSARDGSLGIYIMKPDGTDAQKLATLNSYSILYELSYRWSPNSKKIIFKESKDSLLGELLSFDIDSEQLTNLTNTPHQEATPVWSPDGEKIAYRRGQLGLGEIYIMNADGSEQTNLTNHPAADRDPAFSPCLPVP